MADVSDTVLLRTPWHLWVVGVLALLWNGASCYSYVMTRSANAAYFDAAGLTPDMVEYFAALSAWYVAAWSVGVWVGLFASLCLLIRRSWAVWLFAISLLGMTVISAATVLNADARAMFGQVGLIITAMTVVIGVLELLYSRAMKRNSVLR